MTRRARYFVDVHGHRLDGGMSDAVRGNWQTRGIPAPVVQQMAAFETQWGGLLLPPAPRYDGGPKIFRSDKPEIDTTGEWWFDAGDQRCSMGYSFCIGPRGEFAIEDGRGRAVLHDSVAGWVESLALAHSATFWAPHITTVHGTAVDGLDLSAMEQFPEVAGVSNTWWRGEETVIAVYRGEAQLFGDPALQVGTIYSGITNTAIRLDY
ncbi:hypothetical protein AB0H83_50405 [Dactylosporangium sp. NPDC050688]|uniref:hypothetical protein n=1 Tax=Dactylosporangium sp. NPDC050688 TaxID=3157217 RepID=UPI0033D16078